MAKPVSIRMKCVLAFALGALVCSALLEPGCHRGPEQAVRLAPFTGVDTAMVDSVLAQLTIQEKIGQLILYEPELAPDSAEIDALLGLVESGKVGGFLIRRLDVRQHTALAEVAQKLAPLPLFVATAEKVSLHNHFANLPAFPSLMSMAALDSTALWSSTQQRLIEQCRAAGVNTLLAPSLKSFFDDPQSVEVLPDLPTYRRSHIIGTIELAREHRMLSVGDALCRIPFIENDTLRDSLLVDVRMAGAAGMGGLLVDDEIFEADTLVQNPNLLPTYLDDHADFGGLIFSRLSKLERPFFKLYCGVDVLLTSDPLRTYFAIVKLLERKRIDEAFIDARVRKVLIAKAWQRGGWLTYRNTLSLHGSMPVEARPVNLPKLPEGAVLRDKVLVKADALGCYFEDPAWRQLANQLHRASITLIRDSLHLLPLQLDRARPVSIWTYTERRPTTFLEIFGRYADYSNRMITPAPSGFVSVRQLPQPPFAGPVVLLFDQVNMEMDENKPFLDALEELAQSVPLVIVNVGQLRNLPHFPAHAAVIQVYERNEEVEDALAQVLCGGRPVGGQLPVRLGAALRPGTGTRLAATRVGFASPEFVGIAPERLVGIDAIALSSIDDKAFPGCQVAVIKDGQVIYAKAFGKFDYRKGAEVRLTSLYDVASITKAAATTLAIMHLYEQGALELDTRLSKLLDLPADAPVGKVTIEELLRHRSGLPAQPPISRYFGNQKIPYKGCNEFFCRYKKKGYEVEVCDHVYFRSDQVDSIWSHIFRLRVDSRKPVRYSDVNFLLLQKVVETKMGKPLDEVVDSLFYKPLGLRYTTFKPLNRFSKNVIVPTENDRSWRRTLVHGFVHDPAAALLGGVAGNAGLFSTAEETAIIFQMLLQDGTYGGRRFFSEKTVRTFTKGRRNELRALGFDRPVGRKFPTYSELASTDSFGHTGFTGTCVWADPDQQLVFVFLSNRIHPDARNSRIRNESVRSRIHDVVYHAIGTWNPRLPVLPVFDENGN